MKRLLLILCLLFPAGLIAQTTYYVSSSGGNDTNPGTSESLPWKTLNKVNSFKPKPGDQILFKNGDIWEGTLTPTVSGTSGSPVTYGSYGTGTKPTIYGSTVISGWTKYSGNIYKATISSPVKQLFLDGTRLKAARFPNNGYASINSVVNSTQFTSSDLKSDVNYTGANWVGRSGTWAFSTRKVIASSSQSLTLSDVPSYNLNPSEGFFVCNKLEFLDASGEWYFDSSTGNLYLWTPNGDSPENHTIRGSIFDSGIKLSDLSYITFKNLAIKQAGTYGIYGYKCSYLKIDNNEIIDADRIGISLSSGNTTNNVITNNLISGSNDLGVFTQGSNNLIFSHNKIHDIALFNNLGLTGMGNGSGAMLIGDYNTISNNQVRNTGYNGINFRGINNIVEKNFIQNSCLVIEDGGAIYTYSADYSLPGSAGSIVRNNIIDYVPGNIAGTDHSFGQGVGIYTDGRIHDVTIKDNTIYKCSYIGIFLSGTNSGIIADGNTIMNCRYGIHMKDDVGINKFINNKIYALEKNIENFDYERLINTRNVTNIAQCDSNIYIDHYRNSDVFRFNESYSSFDQWKTLTGQDVHSTFDDSPLAQGEVEKLFYNETEQDKVINLGNYIYKDIYGNQITGNLTLKPFTSKILIKTTNTTGDNLPPVIQNQIINIIAPNAINDFLGQVIASDPDVSQTLTYSIIQGNDAGYFAINPSTGEILVKKDIPSTLDQSFVLSVQVIDDAIIPLSATANITINVQSSSSIADTSAPLVSAFSIPSSSSSLTIPILSFNASDDNAITGYKLTESPIAPLASDSGWVSTIPTDYSFSQEGTMTLYAWAKDSAGNVSDSKYATINIILSDLSPTYSEYLFEESSGTIVIDTKGSNDGTIVNEESRVDGVSGKGLAFTGTGYITLGQVFSNNVQNELTLSAWIKPDATTDGYQGIIMHGGPNVDTYALYILQSSNRIAFKTSGTSNSWTYIDGVTTLWDGNWHNIAVTYDGSKKSIYMDGSVLLTVDATGTIESGEGYNLLVGAGRDEINPTLLYYGQIDEVRIYNTALSSIEIKDLYNQVKVNNAPIISDQSFDISTAKTKDDLIGKVIASDPDSGQTLSYSIIQGNSSGMFSIIPTTGEIIANTGIDTTVDQTIILGVKVTDDGFNPLSSTATVTINILQSTQTIETNQAPVVADQSFDISSAKTKYDLIGKIEATDSNVGQSLSYSILQGNDAGLFAILPTTGQIIANTDISTAIDQTIDLIVKVTDDATIPLSSTANVTIHIVGATQTVETNQAPVIYDQSFDILTAKTKNDLIGQIVASDPNPEQILSYTILQGNDNGLFAIDSSTGEIFANIDIANMDQTVVLGVEVTDNGTTPMSSTANVTINITGSGKVTEVNQAPVIVDQSFSTTAPLSINKLIGQVVASDANSDQALSYSIISGNDSGLFAINSVSGEIYANADFTTYTDQAIVLGIKVTDNATSPLSAQANVTINLIGAIVENLAPTISDQVFDAQAPLTSTDLIGQVAASDPNTDQTLSYSILSGNETGLFYINTITGEIFTKTDIQTSTDKTFVLTVEVKDNAATSLSAQANMTINIAAVPNHPPVISDQTFEIKKNDQIGDVIGQVTASDPDAGQNLTYSITSGNDNNLFSIDPMTGELFVSNTINVTTSTAFPVVVQVSDNGTVPLSSSANITIDVTINGKISTGVVKNSKKDQIILSSTAPLQTTTLKSTALISSFVLNDNKQITNVTIKGSKIYLDVDSEYKYGDEIKVSYQSEGTPLYDSNGNEIESFTDLEVINDVQQITTDYFEIEVPEVNVYPTLSDGRFTIKANNLQVSKCEVSMFSLNGQIVLNKEIQTFSGNLEENFNLPGLSKGTYIIRLIIGSVPVQKKIVIM